jgi:hypothetical protein
MRSTLIVAAAALSTAMWGVSLSAQNNGQQQQQQQQQGGGQGARGGRGADVQVGVPGGGREGGSRVGQQGRGRGNQPPPGPAPRNAQGRALLSGANAQDKGVWLPSGVGIRDPILATDKTPYQPWAKALFEYRQVNELEPHTRCKASGTARQFQTPYGTEFVELPEIQRIYIFDIGGPHTYRTIYMDGRPHPPADKMAPGTGYYGHSVGHWEGDTLVVDTVNFNESFWMDRRGMPTTDKLHTIEKFTRVNHDQMKYEITVDDPGAYTAPWTTTALSLRWEKGTELFEYDCQQANYATELMVGEFEKVDRSSEYVP